MATFNPFKTEGRTKISLNSSDSCSVYIDADGQIVEASETAATLEQLWLADHEELKAAYDFALDNLAPVEFRIVHGDQVKLWIVAVPYEEGVLFIARDTVLADQLTEALIESRTMLKGLLDTAVDFSFEVGANGNFRFVSPAVAFGSDTERWLHRSAHSIFWPRDNAPVRSPFLQKTAAQLDGILTEINGVKRFLSFSVEPVLDEQGNVLKVRGCCRDMTERTQADRKNRRDKARLAVQHKITRILNETENAQDLLDNASKELIEVMRADLVWSVMRYKDRLVPMSICGDRAETLDLDSIWDAFSDEGGEVQQVKVADRDHLLVRIMRSGYAVGMVIISRDTVVSPWSKQEVELLTDMGDVLTAAFGKAELIDKLFRLSSKDELTDLLNRRALSETVERRLKHQQRTNCSGCLVFIDLDHFKEVNDTLGHKAGDLAIKLVAKKMQEIIRPVDLAGRIGGDEFVMWIEDVTQEQAASKARELIDYMPEIRVAIEGEHLKLGASIGICKSTPGDDLKFDNLAERADAALYNVKKHGKNDIAFAEMQIAV